MRRNIDWWVACFEFQKKKGLSRKKAWDKLVEPLLKQPSVDIIKTGQFEWRPKQTKQFATVAIEEVYDGIPRPYSNPEDVVNQEKDDELNRLEAENVALEKDKRIAELKKVNAELKKKVKSGAKTETGTVQNKKS